MYGGKNKKNEIEFNRNEIRLEIELNERPQRVFITTLQIIN